MHLERTIYLEIKGMHCPNCPAKIERSLTKLDGVRHVEVNYEQEDGYVTINTNKLECAQIINRISKMGFEAKEKDMSKVTNNG
jgi:copper chaperone CopZ